MKKLLHIAIATTVILYFTGCENQTESEIYETTSLESYQAKAGTHNHHEGKMVTLGLNLVFTGNYAAPEHAEECGEGTFPVKNVGTGTGTHFKRVNSYFEFCVRPTATGGTYPEGYLVAYFEDADGDQLFIDLAGGEVFGGRLPGMPSYAISYFKDPFTITGGTGKFEGASGSGMTNDYNFINKDGVQQTSHHWQGSIRMKKGKS